MKKIGCFSIFYEIGLGLRQGFNRTGSVFFSHFLGNLADDFHGFLAGNDRRTLQELVRQEIDVFAIHFPLLVDEMDGKITQPDEGIGIGFLRRPGQDGVMLDELLYTVPSSSRI